LTRLDEAASRALVRQLQGEAEVLAADGVVDDVLIHTKRTALLNSIPLPAPF